MKSKIIIILILLIIIGIICWQYYENQRVDLSLTEVSALESDDNRIGYGAAWYIISTEVKSESFETDFNVILPTIDYEHEMIIASLGREIDSVYYRRKNKSFIWPNKYIGIEEFTGEIKPHTIFIYKTENRDDLISSTEWL